MCTWCVCVCLAKALDTFCEREREGVREREKVSKGGNEGGKNVFTKKLKEMIRVTFKSGLQTIVFN